MIRRPPRSTRTDTPFPYTTLSDLHPADDRPQIIAEVKIARGLNARDDPHLGFPSSTLEVGEHFRVEGTDHPRHAEIDEAAGCDQRADAGHPLNQRSVEQPAQLGPEHQQRERKSTSLNSSHEWETGREAVCRQKNTER